MIQNTKLRIWFMKLKNANFNGCNVLINNLHPMILFFSKNIENQVS